MIRTFYRSWPGDFLLSTYWVVRIGGFDWGALTLHNLLISVVASALLALLAYRLALRIGVIRSMRSRWRPAWRWCTSRFRRISRFTGK
jgi:hypothetical protein